MRLPILRISRSRSSVRNDFRVLAFDGTEALSTLYGIRVELVSENPDFDLESLLNQPAFLRFGLNGEGLHGQIEDLYVGEAGKRLTRYHLTLVPVLHYLQFSFNQRIFQHLTVPQIVAQVLGGQASSPMPIPSMSVPVRSANTAPSTGKRFRVRPALVRRGRHCLAPSAFGRGPSAGVQR